MNQFPRQYNKFALNLKSYSLAIIVHLILLGIILFNLFWNPTKKIKVGGAQVQPIQGSSHWTKTCSIRNWKRIKQEEELKKQEELEKQQKLEDLEQQAKLKEQEIENLRKKQT